jgi:hypothetical protein
MRHGRFSALLICAGSFIAVDAAPVLESTFEGIKHQNVEADAGRCRLPACVLPASGLS